MLADSVSTHLEKVASGSATVHVAYSDGRDRMDFEFIEELVWNQRNVMLSIRLYDPSGFLCGIRQPNKNFKDTPPLIFSAQNGISRVYDPFRNIARIGKYSELDMKRWHFAALPSDTWFSCCPPDLAAGKAWDQVLMPGPELTKMIKSIEIKSNSDNKIVFHRVDTSGGEFVIEFDPKLDHHLTRFWFEKSGVRLREGVYEWKRLESGLIVLGSFTYWSNTEPERHESYRMDVLKYEPRTVPDSRFSHQEFLRRLPSKASLVDNVYGKSRRADEAKALSVDEFHAQSKPLFSNGRFLKH